MRQLVWSPRAREDLFDILEYYDQIDPTLADEIADRIESAPAPLLEALGIGSPTTGGARKWRVNKAPFLLPYDWSDDAVEIVSVVHARSNWRK